MLKELIHYILFFLEQKIHIRKSGANKHDIWIYINIVDINSNINNSHILWILLSCTLASGDLVRSHFQALKLACRGWKESLLIPSRRQHLQSKREIENGFLTQAITFIKLFNYSIPCLDLVDRMFALKCLLINIVLKERCSIYDSWIISRYPC